ncbi:hypothetical protein [Streptomyces asiaticus]|nr:hypothetical protein [Streptomyces asiaticus]
MRLPNLDAYDVQGVRSDEAAAFGEEVLAALEELEAAELAALDLDALI